MPKRGPKPKFEMRCPNPLHEGSDVVAKGPRETKRGTVRRFKCSPLSGDEHTFTVLMVVKERPLPAYGPAPSCPEHPGSHTRKAGTYGRTRERHKQLYRCEPVDDPDAAHEFTQVLSRDHVHVGKDSCADCEELRGEHRGDRTVSRHTSWQEKVVAETLKALAEGKSYAQASKDAWRVSGRERTREPSKEAPPPAEKYEGSAQSANRWHTAADWCEVFSGALWQPLEAELREREKRQRGQRDAATKAGNEPSTLPMVLLLDDIPVNAGKQRDWFVLVAALVEWVPNPRDPMALPRRTVRLRLVRGYPSNDHHAWKLLLDEFGQRPDYVLADAGTGLTRAVGGLYGNSGTVLMPSLFHLRRAVETGLVQRTPGAWTRAGTNAPAVLLPEFSEHLRGLRRRQILDMTVEDWTAWWDELENLLTARGLPVEPTRERRANYETTIASLLPIYQAHPYLPVSTGGLEVALRQKIEPVLTGRSHAFANLERTNRLFDLVVCHDHGVFDNLSQVAATLRADNEAHGGWATPLRDAADHQLPGTRYSSLRDQQLLRDRARKAGLA